MRPVLLRCAPTGIGSYSCISRPRTRVKLPLPERAAADHPAAPDGCMAIAPDARRPGDFVQHYFDSRGVVRLYAMTFDGRTWTLTRLEPDFSPLDFRQRFT